jgi:predicted Zn-dependent peptidase
MFRSAVLTGLVVFTVALGAQAPDRTRPPQPGPPPVVHLPTIQKRQLSNGLPVWLVELHEVPVVQINLVVLRGSADDPAGKFGIATLTAAMLQEGAGARSSLELADAIDFLGADLTTTAGIDSSAVRLHVPVARLAEAVQLMADVALRPTFPGDELDRLRQERLTAILQARDNPATIDATAFNRVLYGTTHRSTPDYFPIQVMNTILGGSFASRLNMNLREKNGYTYGASSGFDMRASAGPFVATAGVQTDKTADALKEFFNELNGIMQPVPADELSRAKNYVSLRFPAGFETTVDISRRLEDAIVYHLPDDYFARYVPNIEGVTAADVQRVAQKYVHPNRSAVVITGDRKAIEPGIQALKLGAIKILTIDDVFGPPPVL